MNSKSPEKLDPFEESKSEAEDDNSSKDDVVNDLNPNIKALSQSSNSENGDHTYNPYSFKRLQDAIFKKDSGAKSVFSKTEKAPQTDSVLSTNQHKDSAQFLPLQSSHAKNFTDKQMVDNIKSPTAMGQSRTNKQANEHLDMPL